MGIISSILCFPYKDEIIIKEEKNFEEDADLNLTKDSNLIKNENEYSVTLENEKQEGEKDIKTNKSSKLKKDLFSMEFLKCLTIAGCTLIFGFLLSNTYRNFGNEKDLDDLGMQSLSKAFTLLNTFSRLIWGIIVDKYGFKTPYIIICINQIICGGLIYLSSYKFYTYFIVVCFGVLSYAGHIILFPNLINHKFGVDNSVILLGICGIFGGISCILGPILTFFIIKDIDDYLTIYLIGSAPTIISLILTFVIKIDKENNECIKDANNEEKNENEKIFERYTNEDSKMEN